MTAPQDLTALYAEVQHFYARQMQLMDRRDFEAFAATFTEDGEFSHTPGQLARTRAGIVVELREFHRRFDDDPVVRRHWFDMLVVDPQQDGSLRATFYALVVDTRPGVDSRLGPSCLVTDVLVRVDGALLNRSRQVRQDRLLLAP
ncbi:MULTISPECIES: nuclear transport factor 2 family protein [unclassified Streptomyces]|uniref:nuclear transport factor 2 family protein n=1 Tax=unclassified Streptomyces TaxID=2593676 RepID=UPI000374FFF2|nr:MULTISPECIES: nuclear transport factor 2 family protein [unclassified Streptomyces]MYT28890.1 nuclear transport factor 2 family protein [Streptomyces sp. SID8354]